ncbi:MAG: FGGY-family carbohydrate kinase [Micropruina sp.]|uniref:xylulokinase n=1 Tax=Micropruina sp. TaxID=2737536 RepID=UPI0039E349F6
MRTFLGLDLGTSATKGVILSADGRVVARARAVHPHSRGGGVGRADPAAWEQSVLAVCRALGPELAGISGVGLDTHCPTVVPMGLDGYPVTLAVTWDNPALAPYFDHYSPLRSTKAIRSTGNHPSRATFAAVAYHYLREAEPDAFARLATLGLAGTWLGQLLTGAVAIDPTQASYTGVFDTVGYEASWLPKTLAELGIDASVLPPVRQAMDVLGETSTGFVELAGIPLGVPVIVGCADTPAASYALGTAPGTSPFLIMGTTHVVNSCLSGPDLRARALQRRGLRPGEWLINGVTNGGDCLAVAASLLGFGGKESAVREVIRLASGLSPDEVETAPFFIPHVMPERGPFWFEQPSAGLTGVTRSTTREQLARAIVDGVIYVDRMVLEATVPPGDQAIYLTGAFGEDPVLPRLLADATGRTYDVALEPDLPAIGAAAMCAEAVHRVVPRHLSTSRIKPRAKRRAMAERRWHRFREEWSKVTGRDPLAPLLPEPARSRS